MAASRAAPCRPAGGPRSPPRRSSSQAARVPHGCKMPRGPSPRPCPAPATRPCQARPTSSNQNPSPRSSPNSSPALRATGLPAGRPRNDGMRRGAPGRPALTTSPTTNPKETTVDLHYSDGIAAARTMIALEGNAAALQRRLPADWELSPYAGDDLRGTSLRGANMLVPFHEVYPVRGQDGQPPGGLAQLSYIAFVSQARNQATGALGHLHWCTYTEDPAGVPGKYGDAALAGITRSQTVTKAHRGQTQVRESFSAVAEGGMVIWATAESRTCRCMPPATRAWCAGTKKTRCWMWPAATRWASTPSPSST